MNKHKNKPESRGSSQQAPEEPQDDPKQEPLDASTDDGCGPSTDLDPESKDTPKQAPADRAKRARSTPAKQEPLGAVEPRHSPESESKSSHTDELLLEVVLRSYSLVLRDMTMLAERLDEIEMALGHVATRTYAPSNARVRDALACVRSRAAVCMKEGRPPTASSVPITGPQTQTSDPARGPNSFARTRELGERVLAAAAHARGRRDEADRLASLRAPAAEIDEAIRVAEEAEAEAFATAEEANAELLG